VAILKDLSGMVFGRLSVVCRSSSSKGRTRWTCSCECGSRRDYFSIYLLKGDTTSCGCLSAEKSDLAGRKFGRLTAVRKLVIKSSQWSWWCVCECGSEKEVLAGSLKSGQTRSCGCLSRDVTSKRVKTHGKSKTRTYKIWSQMLKRCYRPKSTGFSRYGGRGISVCDRWFGKGGFDRFLEDMGEPPSNKHTIDRIDNDGDYEPGNCRWATIREQNRNRSCSRSMTFLGKTRSIMEWSIVTGLSYPCILRRVRSGWSVERTLTEKSRRK